MQGWAASTARGVFVGMMVGVGAGDGVLTGVGVSAGRGVPQADKTKAKEIVILNIQTFFMFTSLVRLNAEFILIGKPIPVCNPWDDENARGICLSKHHG